MDLKSLEERWAVWAVQARRFAKRENYVDAVARMDLVRSSIRETLGDVSDARQRVRLEGLLSRAEDQLAELREQHDAWRSAIAARRQHTIDSAEEEMARPLPTRAD